MNEALSISLLITAIGMGLVFASIVLLWWLMDLLMRVTNLRSPGAAAYPTSPVEDGEAAALHERKQRAAAAAAAIALAVDKETGLHEFPLPPTALVSAWQAVMRASNLGKRGPVR